uniref:Secreted protein n=1 Tax=Arundo donax TaxID=35708 RepID=A0A0A8Z3S5_ARUDO
MLLWELIAGCLISLCCNRQIGLHCALLLCSAYNAHHQIGLHCALSLCSAYNAHDQAPTQPSSISAAMPIATQLLMLGTICVEHLHMANLLHELGQGATHKGNNTLTFQMCDRYFNN